MLYSGQSLRDCLMKGESEVLFAVTIGVYTCEILNVEFCAFRSKVVLK
jgi:hypothetical protein